MNKHPGWLPTPVKEIWHPATTKSSKPFDDLFNKSVFDCEPRRTEFYSWASQTRSCWYLSKETGYLTLGEQMDRRDHMDSTLVQHLLTVCSSLDHNIFSKNRRRRKRQEEHWGQEGREFLQPREGNANFLDKERTTGETQQKLVQVLSPPGFNLRAGIFLSHMSSWENLKALTIFKKLQHFQN